jgi:uncharacterized membrane protein
VAKNYPDVIFNSPQDRNVLRRIFSYEARYYDLNAYEKVLPGGGLRVWQMFEAERAHQTEMKRKNPNYMPR